MKSLVNGCAAAALLMGLAFQAHAEIAVRDAPIHAVPADDDDTGPVVTPAAPTQIAQAEPAPAQSVPVQSAPAQPAPVKGEPAVVKALLQPKAPPPAPVLTPDENAFFTALGGRVTDAASAYESYVRRVTAIDPAFSGAAAVQHAVKAGAAYHAGQLREGMIAYAALIALRNPDFVDGVRAIQNPAFADDLAVHPEAVMQVRGANSAAADAAGVLQAQGAAMMAAGKAITKAAYDIQAQAWSKSPVPDPQGVLAGAKEFSGEMRAATTPSKEKLLASLVVTPQGAPTGATPAPDVVRGVALAAMAILGRTADGAEARYEALLRDASSEECLKMAKLNLNQCLAVAGPHYEDVYCAGRHAVADTGKCIADASAGGGPADAAPRLQEADAIGPEQAAAYGKTASLADDDDDVAQPVPAAPAPAAAPAPTPAPRQYAEAPAAPPQAALQAPPQAALQYAPPQRTEAMPDPRLQQQPPAQAYAQPPQQPQQPAYGYAQNQYPQNQYAQNSYAPAPAPQAPPAQYARTYAQQGYQQPYQQPAPYQQQQSYPQAQYAPQQAYQQPPYPAQQPYQQPPAYAPQSYPQNQGYPAYQNGYYGR